MKDFPDHANFREKSVTTGLVGQAWGFLSLTLCYKANFDPILLVKYDGLQKRFEHDNILWNVFFFLM